MFITILFTLFTLGVSDGFRKEAGAVEIDIGVKEISTERINLACKALRGCQWRMLPREYPKWRTVHEYFTIWRPPQEGQKHCLLEQVLKEIGWRGPLSPGAEREDQLFNRRCTKCE